MSDEPVEDSRHPVAHRVATFVPTSLPVSDASVASLAHDVVTFEVAIIGEVGTRKLSGDPAAPQPVPMARLVANALATFALILCGGLAVAATAPRLIGYGAVVVTSGSMEPAVHQADVVVTQPSDGTNLGEGAVINFDRDDEMVLHRIMVVTQSGYRTAGDANTTADSDEVAPAQVRGVGIVVVPFVGLPATWVANEQWLQLAFALIGLVACLYMSRSRWVDAGQDPLMA